MRVVWIFAALSLIMILCSFCGTARRGEPLAGPLAASDSTLIKGQQVFAHFCHPCHPQADAGLGPAINTTFLADWMIRFQIRHGLGKMPAFSDKIIPDEDVDALIAYVNARRGE